MLETVLQSFTSVLSTVLWMSLNSWWLAKLEAFQQGWASSAQLKIITFQSHTVLVKQAFGLKYAEHSNTEHCAPQQSGLYHRTLSVTHPNHTKPKNRGCDVPKYTQSMSWCMLSHQVSNATGPLDHGCADHTFCSCQCSEVYLLKLWM